MCKENTKESTRALKDDIRNQIAFVNLKINTIMKKNEKTEAIDIKDISDLLKYSEIYFNLMNCLESYQKVAKSGLM